MDVFCQDAFCHCPCFTVWSQIVLFFVMRSSKTPSEVFCAQSLCHVLMNMLCAHHWAVKHQVWHAANCIPVICTAVLINCDGLGPGQKLLQSRGDRSQGMHLQRSCCQPELCCIMRLCWQPCEKPAGQFSTASSQYGTKQCYFKLKNLKWTIWRCRTTEQAKAATLPCLHFHQAASALFQNCFKYKHIFVRFSTVKAQRIL